MKTIRKPVVDVSPIVYALRKLYVVSKWFQFEETLSMVYKWFMRHVN